MKFELTWNPTGSGSCWIVNVISSAGRKSSVTASWWVADVTSVPFTFKMRSPIRNLPQLAAIPPGTIYFWWANIWSKRETEMLKLLGVLRCVSLHVCVTANARPCWMWALSVAKMARMSAPPLQCQLTHLRECVADSSLDIIPTSLVGRLLIWAF